MLNSAKQKRSVICRKSEIHTLPSATGVYLFRKNEEILYIGKAVSIKARLMSHLENAKLDPKEARIIQNSNRIDYYLTDSEFKALLLESSLIQKHQPKYNLRWKDNKSYIYIKITINDEYPKIYTVRKESDSNSLYFGPFPSQHDAELILASIRKLFPFCRQKKFSKYACFYSKIGLCSPCPNYISSLKDEAKRANLRKIYLKNIRAVKSVLEGKVELILKNSYLKLKELAKQKNFEKALNLRDKIRHFEQMIYQKQFSSDISRNFNRAADALENLKDTLKVYFSTLQKLRRVECYDVSSLLQKDATASMVVFLDGMANRAEYRRFRIKSKKSKSDLEMLEEIFLRRFKQDWPRPDLIVVDGGTPQVLKIKQVLEKLNHPNPLTKLASLPISHLPIPLIGIAKHPDRLVINSPPKLITVRPQTNNLGFNLVRSMRDEAHRFARKYHLLLREKRMMI